jgi:hypothetical protein
MTSDELDLNVNARRQVIEALQGVHRLGGGLQDVDQALVRADLEVLAESLSLNGERITQ